VRRCYGGGARYLSLYIPHVTRTSCLCDLCKLDVNAPKLHAASAFRQRACDRHLHTSLREPQIRVSDVSQGCALMDMEQAPVPNKCQNRSKCSILRCHP
jgi:hypothetical protein